MQVLGWSPAVVIGWQWLLAGDAILGGCDRRIPTSKRQLKGRKDVVDGLSMHRSDAASPRSRGSDTRPVAPQAAVYI